MDEQEAVLTDGKNRPLEFTGNWFIDAGILGFVNLMEEVYGWDLEELQEKIKENEELIYYGYFPFAYLFYNSTIRTANREIGEEKKNIKQMRIKLKEKRKGLSLEKDRKISESKENSSTVTMKKKIDKIKKDIAEKENKINESNNKILDITSKLNNDKEKFITDVENGIRAIVGKPDANDIKSIIPNFDLRTPPEHRNFFLYNPKKDLPTSFRYLHYLLRKDYENLRKLKNRSSATYEKIPDSTVNAFFYSTKEFPNLGYTTPLKSEEIENSLKMSIPIYVVFLAFYNAFQYIQGRNIVFYMNNLNFCYNTNRKIKLNIKMLEKKQVLFVTWSSIIDEIIENRSNFSIENIYMIEFEKIKNQKILNVEYIGMSKLYSSIIIDDILRRNINKSIQFKPHSFKGNKYAWILEQLIKGKPLYPIIFSHTALKFLEAKNRFHFNIYTSLYALAVEANIKHIARNSNLFSDDFFNFSDYGNIVDDIKKTFSVMTLIKNAAAAKDLFQEESERKRLGYELLSALRGKNKNSFVNILVKHLVNKDSTSKEKLVDWYVHKYIVNNDKSWEYYALPIIVGLV